MTSNITIVWGPDGLHRFIADLDGHNDEINMTPREIVDLLVDAYGLQRYEALGALFLAQRNGSHSFVGVIRPERR